MRNLFFKVVTSILIFLRVATSILAPSKARRASSGKVKTEPQDLLAMLDERYKYIEPDRPAKRARPNFLGELSSDTDEDVSISVARPTRAARDIILPSVNGGEEDPDVLPALRRGKRKVVLSSDDFDPSAEPNEDDDNEVELDVGASDDESTYQESEPSSPPQRATKGKGKVTTRTTTKDERKRALLQTYDVEERIPSVLLISLKAGALGLQLTAANNVYLMVSVVVHQVRFRCINRTALGPLVAGMCKNSTAHLA